MKAFIITYLLTITIACCFGQVATPSPVAESIPSLRVGICAGKTTNLIFRYAIISVDRGSQDLLVQKVKAAENILQIKAATGSFAETNLSVVTADKKLHSFIITYDSSPAILNYRLANEKLDSVSHSWIEVTPASLNLTEAEIENNAILVSDSDVAATRIKDKKFGVSVRLKGIFIKQDIFFFSLQLQNTTPVRYDIESLTMLIKDQQQGKRTATQEIQVFPVLVHGNQSWIESESTQSLVLAVPKFTIPDKKDFIVQLRESNGGRHLSFQVKNKRLIKAIPL